VWGCTVAFIVGACFIHLHAIGETAPGVASLAFFPLTYTVYTW
jgi:hypothetical protein